MKTLRLLLLFLTGLLGLMSCQHDAAPEVPVTQLEKYLANDPQYSTFYAGLRKTGLLPELKPGESFTVLAPTDDAFAQLSTPYDDFSTADRINALTDAGKLQLLREVLQYHLLPGQQLSSLSIFPSVGRAQFTTLLAAPSTARRELQVVRHFEVISINGLLSGVTSAVGVPLAECTVHPLRRVLLPGTQSLAALIQEQARQTGGQHALFWQALQRPAAAALLAELTSPQTDYTVLLPSDTGLLDRWQQQNPAWTSLSAVPDKDLLKTLRLHIVSQHLTSNVFLGMEKSPTTLSSDILKFTGSYTWPNASNPSRYSFQVCTLFYSGVEDQQTPFLQIDHQASNGVMHLLNGAIKPW
ncbi:fasciclin domain-containing protein [Hymenobacter sp. 102]|uniref:fasciclin domain-containing protein n=1 Tax=Hymenobacter sp. 102 TaxID=3403152 RepID=UPI003CF3D6A2